MKTTCETCYYWEPYGHTVSDLFKEMGSCTHPSLQEAGIDNLHAGETESYPQEPSTGRNFGCIHHTPSNP